jgi:hypothetical protein
MQRKRARAAEPIARYSSTLGATEQRHPALVKTAFLMRSAITAGRRASRSSALGFRKVTTRIRSRIGPGSGSSVVRCANIGDVTQIEIGLQYGIRITDTRLGIADQ